MTQKKSLLNRISSVDTKGVIAGLWVRGESLDHLNDTIADIENLISIQLKLSEEAAKYGNLKISEAHMHTANGIRMALKLLKGNAK